MRKGFDGLSGLVLQYMQEQPLDGSVYIFLNKHRNRIKLLHWQGDGFALYYKQLEKGTYEIPLHPVDSKSILLTPEQLQFILAGIVLESVRKRRRYQPSSVDKM